MKLSYQQGNILQSNICYILGLALIYFASIGEYYMGLPLTNESLCQSTGPTIVFGCVEKQLVMGIVQQPPLNATRHIRPIFDHSEVVMRL